HEQDDDPESDPPGRAPGGPVPGGRVDDRLRDRAGRSGPAREPGPDRPRPPARAGPLARHRQVHDHRPGGVQPLGRHRRGEQLDGRPAEVAFGGTIAFKAAAVDVDHVPSPLGFSWSATSGSIGAGTTANPTLTCTKVGKVTVTLSVSDGDPACATAQSVDVVCTEPAPQTPIKHVIVLIGENRTFDHTFGTYAPRDGQ